MDHLEGAWGQTANGLWEMRGPRRLLGNLLLGNLLLANLVLGNLVLGNPVLGHLPQDRLSGVWVCLLRSSRFSPRSRRAVGAEQSG